jgi:hypothetical protein
MMIVDPFQCAVHQELEVKDFKSHPQTVRGILSPAGFVQVSNETLQKSNFPHKKKDCGQAGG